MLTHILPTQHCGIILLDSCTFGNVMSHRFCHNFNRDAE